LYLPEDVAPNYPAAIHPMDGVEKGQVVEHYVRRRCSYSG